LKFWHTRYRFAGDRQTTAFQKQGIKEETMDRRAFLGAMAAGATATAVKAATERPFGETGVPLQGSEPLPLGPLPGGRYPDPQGERWSVPGSPEIVVVSNVTEGGRPIGVRRAGENWHSDMC
jgi:hypothetical protein